MHPDEFLRLENKCMVMFKGHKPAQLYKIALEELPRIRGAEQVQRL